MISPKLSSYYEALHTRSMDAIEKGAYQLDPLPDPDKDTRFGITLIIRPSREVRQEVSLFLEALKAVDPAQYYYPDPDMHVTVLSVISCYKGFQWEAISVPAYVRIIQESLQETKRFQLLFKGVAATDSCLLIRGFPDTPALETLRDNLRANFKNSGLEQSIDQRYAIHTAHSTVVRFKRNLKDPKAFLGIVKKYAHHPFGVSPVQEVALVCNDWYQREQNTRILNIFNL